MASQVVILLHFLWLSDANMWLASQSIVRRGREGVVDGRDSVSQHKVAIYIL